MLKIGSIVWGVQDIPKAIQFWSEALGYRLKGEPSEDWAMLVPKVGSGLQLSLKLVTSEANNHRRHHLDLFTANQATEVERLMGLGAQQVEWQYEPGADYVVLADPDGNRFCVVQV